MVYHGLKGQKPGILIGFGTVDRDKVPELKKLALGRDWSRLSSLQAEKPLWRPSFLVENVKDVDRGETVDLICKPPLQAAASSRPKGSKISSSPKQAFLNRPALSQLIVLFQLGFYHSERNHPEAQKTFSGLYTEGSFYGMI